MTGWILMILKLIRCFILKGVMPMYDNLLETGFWIYSVIGIIITIQSAKTPSQPYRFNLLMRL
ncbi:hypothetical protein [Paraclostridium tenue]